MKKVEIYVDGACKGNPGPGGYAAIIKCGDEIKEISGCEPYTTNNRMELRAAIEALKQLREPSHVILYTDSNYVVKGMKEWISNWIERNWLTSQKKEVLNKDLWIELLELSRIHKIEWVWIKGHNRHPENERCDSLARSAIEECERKEGMKLITKENVFLSLKERPWKENYLAMYSSLFQGFTTDPDLMFIPIDDHVAHRGDGVFEVMRCVNGKVYKLKEHLERLERSAKRISLSLPKEYGRIEEIIEKLIELSKEKDLIIRILVSRGPGSFSVNPYDCPESYLYVNSIRYKSPPKRYYEKGVILVTSHIPMKSSFFANIKSCNYLPNMLMRMEAIQEGADFSVALDEEGYLAEGATENIAVLGRDDILRFPKFKKTLEGITAKQVFEFAKRLVNEGILRDVTFSDIPKEDAYEAKEIFLTGTTIDIVPVVEYDGHKIGDGKPGPIFKRLLDMLRKDMNE